MFPRSSSLGPLILPLLATLSTSTGNQSRNAFNHRYLLFVLDPSSSTSLIARLCYWAIPQLQAQVQLQDGLTLPIGDELPSYSRIYNITTAHDYDTTCLTVYERDNKTNKTEQCSDIICSSDFLYKLHTIGHQRIAGDDRQLRPSLAHHVSRNHPNYYE